MNEKYSTDELVEEINVAFEARIESIDDGYVKSGEERLAKMAPTVKELTQGIKSIIIAKLRAGEVLLSAAKEYVDRMEEIYDNESYKGIWGLAYAHGVKYDGPNDVEARKNIRKAIAGYEGREP